MLAAPAVFADPGAEKTTKSRSFFDPPRTIGFEVHSEKAADKRTWISFSAQIESVFRCPMAKIMETLWDFESSPKVFKRIESVRVRSDDGTVAVTEQKSVIRVLGVSYVSELVFENEQRKTGDTTAVFTFKAVEVDANTKSTAGSWRMEEFVDSSGTVSTRIVYTVESVVAATVPGQEFFIRSFGEGDIKNLMRELATAVKNRG
jgi:hypothetical protein